MSDTAMPAPVILTQQAIDKVGAMIAEEGDLDLKLRVYISGGGCSGFKYNFAFDDKAGEDDMVLDGGGVTLLIDGTTYPYMMGATVDYREGLEGARFIITNPNAASTCGCGSSFSV